MANNNKKTSSSKPSSSKPSPAPAKTYANDKGPAGNTAPKTSPFPPGQPQAVAPRSSGGGLGSQLKAAGAVLTNKEALQIAADTGKSIAQIMDKALQNGQGLNSGLVNSYSKNPAAAQPYLTATRPESLNPLAGLLMQKGQVYMGATQYNTPRTSVPQLDGGFATNYGTTTYNPIVTLRGMVPGGRKAPAAAAPAAPADASKGPVGEWEESVNNSNQALIDAINEQIKANASQAELYMGQINSLMQSMNQASQNGGLQSITPYAVTSTSVDPASGAKTTSAITPRKKPTDTDLSISPLVSSLAGTGLNIGI
jgi:hypothetical protein